MATSTGLAAPLLALDGLPTQLAPPDPVAWDTMAGGSVRMTAARVQPLEGTVEGLLGVADEISHLRRATPWVRAAGVEGAGLATADEVARAADALGIEVPEEVDGAAVQTLREATFQRTRDVVRALGLERSGHRVTAADVQSAATALAVPSPQGVTPQVVEAVLATGRDAVTDHLDQLVTPYAVALGLDIGRRADVADTRAVAAELGVELPDVPDEGAAERLHRAWLQTLRPYFKNIGIDPGGSVDPVDLVNLGAALGADLDSGVGPADVQDLLDTLDDPGFVPPVVGTIGGAQLHLPSRAVLLAGWHEAAGPSALAMAPTGTPATTQLPSRGRPHDPHSALDVAVVPGTQALAPVTGTVVEATPYLLYGQHADTRIVIRPDAAPEVLVAVLHVTGPLVEVGDHVDAGDPLAAHATQFPFRSQIENQTGRAPHIHIEVKAG